MNKSEYKNIIKNMYEGVYYVDVNREILFWNEGAERITGFKAEEVIGSHCFDNILNHQDTKGNKLCHGGCPLHKSIVDKKTRDSAVYLHHKDGQRVAVTVRTFPIYDNGEMIGAAEVFTDDTEKISMKNDLENLKQIAMYDQLTELPNRRYLDTYLNSRISEFKTLGIKFGVIFIDIDHFKHFNDQYGHDIGDLVLKMVSKTYMSAIRNSDLIGRWGGEEFIAIVTGVELDNLKKIAEKLRKLVEASELRTENEGLKVTISLGGTMMNESDTIETLIKRADKLMYKSKTNGRNMATVE